MIKKLLGLHLHLFQGYKLIKQNIFHFLGINNFLRYVSKLKILLILK